MWSNNGPTGCVGSAPPVAHVRGAATLRPITPGQRPIVRPDRTCRSRFGRGVRVVRAGATPVRFVPCRRTIATAAAPAQAAECVRSCECPGKYRTHVLYDEAHQRPTRAEPGHLSGLPVSRPRPSTPRPHRPPSRPQGRGTLPRAHPQIAICSGQPARRTTTSCVFGIDCPAAAAYRSRVARAGRRTFATGRRSLFAGPIGARIRPDDGDSVIASQLRRIVGQGVVQARTASPTRGTRREAR